jgi:hypothetical protein
MPSLPPIFVSSYIPVNIHEDSVIYIIHYVVILCSTALFFAMYIVQVFFHSFLFPMRVKDILMYCTYMKFLALLFQLVTVSMHVHVHSAGGQGQ